MATSKTSARVGIWLSTIDIIIWVAVMTTQFMLRARWIRCFWTPGSSASPISTPRSPRATMIASEAEMMPSMTDRDSARSILAMIPASPFAALTRARASRTSFSSRGNDIAI